jgi:hypothetical protein
MKTRSISMCALMFLVSLTCTLPYTPAHAQAKPQEFDLHRLSWLEGLWTGTKDGVETEERWTSTKGGALLGLHRDVKNGRMVWFEFFRVDTTQDGAFYFASPGAAAATPFRLVSMGDRRVVFENKAHDFPQRILYWLDAEGSLHARIEGPKKGKEVAEEWIWKKSTTRVLQN